MDKISVVHNENNKYEYDIVANMCQNSFSKNMVQEGAFSDISNARLNVILSSELMGSEEIKQAKGKFLILGALTSAWQDFFELNVKKEKSYEFSMLEKEGVTCSNCLITYQENVFGNEHPLARYLIRYDYTDEWNNHGYGKITFGGGHFDIANLTSKSPWEKAAVLDEEGWHVTSYMCLKDTDEASFLWFNRPVGPVDSWEWHFVEDFFANYRCEELPCVPYITEVPAEYEGAVTMRLDCDQDISTARSLWEMYADEGVPMSLALTTGNNIDVEDMSLVQDVLKSGGAVLSHSMNHYPNWGGNLYGARMEALGSRFWLEKNIGKPFTDHPYAVSPFHQNPVFAVKELKNAGYKGFAAGSVHNDPEFTLARGGTVPFVSNIVSLSNQCMLHGDCYHAYGNSVKPYCEAFDIYYWMRGIFGYLDHPSSSTYQYGWQSDKERIKAHKELIQYVKSFSGIYYFNLSSAMDFIKEKTDLKISISDDDAVIEHGNEERQYRFKIIYKQKEFIV